MIHFLRFVSFFCLLLTLRKHDDTIVSTIHLSLRYDNTVKMESQWEMAERKQKNDTCAKKADCLIGNYYCRFCFRAAGSSGNYESSSRRNDVRR